MKHFLKEIHRKIPPKIRSFYTPLYWKYLYFLDTYIKTILRTYLPVIVYEGTHETDKESLIFAYAGTCQNTQEYWAQKVFPSGCRKRFSGRYWFWKIPQGLKKDGIDCHLMLIETNNLTLKYFARKPGFRMARWMHMDIDITKPLKEIWKRGKNDIPRRIRKNKLEFETTRNPDDLEDFYYNMHLPYIQNRYEEIADLPDYPMVKKMLSIGELFLIKKDGEVLAGTLLEYHGNVVKMRVLGVRNGNWEYVRYGVIGATYYFAIIEMQERGFQKVHIGGTRPILNDGLTKYKITLNARIIPEVPTLKYSMWMMLLKDSPGLRHFLAENPFAYYSKEYQSRRALFIDPNGNMTEEEFKKKYSFTDSRSFERTDIFSFTMDKKLSDYVSTVRNAHAFIEPARFCFTDKKYD